MAKNGGERVAGACHCEQQLDNPQQAEHEDHDSNQDDRPNNPRVSVPTHDDALCDYDKLTAS